MKEESVFDDCISMGIPECRKKTMFLPVSTIIDPRIGGSVAESRQLHIPTIGQGTNQVREVGAIRSEQHATDFPPKTFRLLIISLVVLYPSLEVASELSLHRRIRCKHQAAKDRQRIVLQNALDHLIGQTFFCRGSANDFSKIWI